MTKHPDLFAALAYPFEPEEVKDRPQGGRQLHYVTARTVMNRLDNVLGPENWWDEYTPAENSVLCRLTIRLPNEATLTKADAGGYAGMPDSGDDDKSGYSDAFKRAAVKFGVGRYLYRDGVPDFGVPAIAEARPQSPAPKALPSPSTNGNGHHKERRDWPGAEGHTHAPSPRPTATAEANGRSGHDGPPKTGKALFAWVKDQEQRHEVSLLKYLNSWAKLNELPGRMVDWDTAQVALGHAEAIRKLSHLPGDQQD